MNRILLSAVAIISITTASMAQTVPNYVPTNGLVGWWPFNGNANDESGTGNNGTVNGATLTIDRFSNANYAYSFNGTSSSITFPQLFIFNQSGDASLSIWINKGTIPNGQGTYLYSTLSTVDANRFNFYFNIQNSRIDLDYRNPVTLHQLNISNNFINNSWEHVIYTRIGNVYNLYINGQFVNSSTDASPNLPTAIGWVLGADPTSIFDFKGNLDDIGIWNRALTQQEITALYQSCNLNASISPSTALLNTGANAQFTSSAADPNATFQWQSNADNFGWLNVPTNNFYSGATSNTLAVNNIQLGNHNQPFRVIATAGSCVDTSATAFIQITDTCVNTVIDTNYVNQTIYDTTHITVTDTNYVTVYDTVTTYISVTDTLFIDINTVGLNNNPVVNTIKVFPNPSNSILNLNYGNYAALNNYRVKITNALGQTIYDQPITQQSEILDLSTFGGNGIYYLNILNPQGNVVEVRKIVLQ
jgi:hypothetical protein